MRGGTVREKRSRWDRLLSIACVGALLILAPGTARGEDAIGEALLVGDRLEDARAAAQRWEARAVAAPESFEARLGAARALNHLMAARTNGNLPTFDGLQDSDRNKAIWADLGSRALRHARAALSMRPGSVDAAAVLATAFMFHASSRGILEALLSGTASEFRENAQRVIDLGRAHAGAVGQTLLGGFYMVAPWPIGDLDRARRHYEAAARIAPGSVRNQFGLGVYWARQGDAVRARPHFERALAEECVGNPERLLCAFMKSEARRALASLGGGG